MLARIAAAMIEAGMILGGISCIVVGLESGNHGAPIAGAMLIIAGLYLAAKSVGGKSP